MAKLLSWEIGALTGRSPVPVFNSRKAQEASFKPGDTAALAWMIEQLDLAKEESLEWPQVLEFRNDEEAKRNYRRLLHWLDKDMASKSLEFVQDEMSQRLEDYKWALKKHGVETFLSTASALIDHRALIAAATVAAPLAVLGQSEWGALSAGGVLLGKALLSVRHTQLEKEDIERTKGRDIAFLLQIESRFKERD
jgi:hypothetical protein